MQKKQDKEADRALEDINVSIAAAQADHSRLAEEIRVLECHMIDYEKRLKSEREILSQISENLSTLSAERQSIAQECSRLASSVERSNADLFLTQSSLLEWEKQLEIQRDLLRRRCDSIVENCSSLVILVQQMEETAADLKKEFEQRQLCQKEMEALRLRSVKRLSKIQDLLQKDINRQDWTNKSVAELEAKFLESKTNFDSAVALSQALEEQLKMKSIECIRIQENRVKSSASQKLLELKQTCLKVENSNAEGIATKTLLIEKAAEVDSASCTSVATDNTQQTSILMSPVKPACQVNIADDVSGQIPDNPMSKYFLATNDKLAKVKPVYQKLKGCNIDFEKEFDEDLLCRKFVVNYIHLYNYMKSNADEQRKQFKQYCSWKSIILFSFFRLRDLKKLSFEDLLDFILVKSRDSNWYGEQDYFTTTPSLKLAIAFNLMDVVTGALNDPKYFKTSSSLPTQLSSDDNIEATGISSHDGTIQPPPFGKRIAFETTKKSVEMFSALFNELAQVKPVYRKINGFNFEKVFDKDLLCREFIINYVNLDQCNMSRMEDENQEPHHCLSEDILFSFFRLRDLKKLSFKGLIEFIFEKAGYSDWYDERHYFTLTRRPKLLVAFNLSALVKEALDNPKYFKPSPSLQTRLSSHGITSSATIQPPVAPSLKKKPSTNFYQ